MATRRQPKPKPKWKPAPLEIGTPSFRRESGWSQLHGLDDDPPVTASERLQYCHFMTFLASRYIFRHAPSTGTKIGEATNVVLRFIRTGWNSSIWTWLLLAIKRFARFQNGLLRAHQKMRLRRESTLNRWLQYWQQNEAKIRQKIRQTDTSLDLSPSSKSRRALVRAMSMTPDRLKVEILWSLYWLLWAEVSHRAVIYWGEWLPVVHFRSRVSAEQAMGVYNPNLNPRSLLEANAAFFIKALQAPKFHFVEGRDITFKELLRFASPTVPCSFDLPPTAPPHLAAFLSSPLCQDPDWLLQRSQMPGPLVPPCTWWPPIVAPVSPSLPTANWTIVFPPSPPPEPGPESPHRDKVLLALPPCTTNSATGTGTRRRLNSCTPNPQRSPDELRCPNLANLHDKLRRRKSDSPYHNRGRSPSMLSPHL